MSANDVEMNQIKQNEKKPLIQGKGKPQKL